MTYSRKVSFHRIFFFLFSSYFGNSLDTHTFTSELFLFLFFFFIIFCHNIIPQLLWAINFLSHLLFRSPFLSFLCHFFFFSFRQLKNHNHLYSPIFRFLLFCCRHAWIFMFYYFFFFFFGLQVANAFDDSVEKQKSYR